MENILYEIGYSFGTYLFIILTGLTLMWLINKKFNKIITKLAETEELCWSQQEDLEKAITIIDKKAYEINKIKTLLNYYKNKK